MKTAIATPENPDEDKHEAKREIERKSLNIADLAHTLKAIDEYAYQIEDEEIASALHPLVSELYDSACDINNALDKL